jgi:hypothetical protein
MSGKSGLASCSGAMPARPRRNAANGRQSSTLDAIAACSRAPVSSTRARSHWAGASPVSPEFSLA